MTRGMGLEHIFEVFIGFGMQIELFPYKTCGEQIILGEGHPNVPLLEGQLDGGVVVARVHHIAELRTSYFPIHIPY